MKNLLDLRAIKAFLCAACAVVGLAAAGAAPVDKAREQAAQRCKGSS